jgi:hypothetical protein
MQSLILEPTNYSPQVAFYSTGQLNLKGRSLMLDAVAFYRPLLEWVSLLDCQSVCFNIELDYFNTASSKKLLDLLKMIEDLKNVQEFTVSWGFEVDDEDILEKGHIFKEKIKNARFLFRELAGV